MITGNHTTLRSEAGKPFIWGWTWALSLSLSFYYSSFCLHNICLSCWRKRYYPYVKDNTIATTESFKLKTGKEIVLRRSRSMISKPQISHFLGAVVGYLSSFTVFPRNLQLSIIKILSYLLKQNVATMPLLNLSVTGQIAFLSSTHKQKNYLE